MPRWRAARIFVGRSVWLGLRDVEMLMAVILPVLLLFTYVFGGAFGGAVGGGRAAYLNSIVLLGDEQRVWWRPSKTTTRDTRSWSVAD